MSVVVKFPAMLYLYVKNSASIQSFVLSYACVNIRSENKPVVVCKECSFESAVMAMEPM